MKRHLSQSRQAFTLVEVMVSVAIFIALLAGLFTAFLTAQKTWGVFESRAVAQRDVRMIFAVLERDFREARGIVATNDDHSVQISFTRGKRGLIIYSWSNTGPNAHKLFREEDLNKRMLSESISYFSLKQFPKIVEVEIEALKLSRAGTRASYRLKERIGRR